MTLRRPDELSTMRWLTSGVNLKTLVAAIIFVVSAHYIQANRITVVEQVAPAMKQRMDEIEKRQDQQRDLLSNKVDVHTYEAEQQRQAEDLRSIRDSLGRIESILMEHPRSAR